MKKILITALALLSMAWNAQAIRPLRKAETIKQSDGTTIQAFKHGDQFCAYFTTLDGKVLYSNMAGDLCYARMDRGQLVATEMIAHDPQMRSQAEKDFISSIDIDSNTPEVRKLAMRNEPNRIIGTSTADGLGKKGSSASGAVNSIGEVKVPVILVSYKDVKLQPTSTVEKYNNYFNKKGYNDEPMTVGSVKDYYEAQSNGIFKPTFDVVARVQLSQNRAYYGGNRSGSTGGDLRVTEMIKEAVRLAMDQRGDNYFDKFVVNGSIQNVTVVFAGLGEAYHGAPAECVWPHELDFEADIEGYHFKSYFVGNELGPDQKSIAGIGVFCHEFGHALGLPDFYPTDYSYDDDYAFGDWSLMEAGCYAKNGNAPIGMMAYERSYLGWLDIPVLETEGTVRLDDINNPDGKPARVIRNPQNPMEYFIVENRQVGTWYPESYGSGLMLTHVTFSKSTWQWNRPNNNKNAKRAHIITADGSKITNYTSGTQNQLFGNGVNDANQDFFKLYFGGTLSNCNIYKVIEHGDKSITFNFKNKNLPDNYETTGTQKFEKVNDVNSLHDGDKVIFVNEETKMAMTTKVLKGKRTATTIKINGDNTVTPDTNAEVFTLKIVNGVYSFKIEADNIYLGMTRNGLGTIANINDNSRANITIANGNATVKFKGRYSSNVSYDTGNLYFYSEKTNPEKIQLYRISTDPTGIDGITQDSNDNAEEKIYNLNGQRVTRENMHRGIYIINGKKVIVK